MGLKHSGYRVASQGLRTVAGRSQTLIVGDSPGTPNARLTCIYLETFAANDFSYAVAASSSGKNIPGCEAAAPWENIGSQLAFIE